MSGRRQALLSVSDKAGVVDFARALLGLGFRILSTGGTAKLLEKEGVAVTEVSAHTMAWMKSFSRSSISEIIPVADVCHMFCANTP